MRRVSAIRKSYNAFKGFVKHWFETNVISAAAETAFYLLLSFFPLLLFASAVLSGLDLQPDWTFGILPKEITDMLADSKLPDISSPWLFAASLWAASAGIWALMKGCSAVYTRGRLRSIKARLMAIVFTLGFVAVLTMTLALVVMERHLGLIASGFSIFALLFTLYSFAPGKKVPFRRCAISAAIATVGWIAVSRGFEIYIRRFSAYTAVYGSIGMFLGLALWLFIICIVILTCAEFCGYNAPPRLKNKN